MALVFLEGHVSPRDGVPAWERSFPFHPLAFEVYGAQGTGAKSVDRLPVQRHNEASLMTSWNVPPPLEELAQTVLRTASDEGPRMGNT
jgi:hypothetical protein